MQRLVIIGLCVLAAGGVLWLMVERGPDSLDDDARPSGSAASEPRRDRSGGPPGSELGPGSESGEGEAAGAFAAAREGAGSDRALERLASSEASEVLPEERDGDRDARAPAEDEPGGPLPFDPTQASLESESDDGGGAGRRREPFAPVDPALAALEAHAAAYGREAGLIDESLVEAMVESLPPSLSPEERERARIRFEADQVIVDELVKARLGPDPSPGERARVEPVARTLTPLQSDPWRVSWLKRVPGASGSDSSQD